MGKPKGGGKGPAICTDPEALAPFELKMGDMVRTPLGMTGTVIGVKFDNPESRNNGRVWVAYADGLKSPLEPRLGAGCQSGLAALDYSRTHEADHIRRDLGVVMETLKGEENERKLAAKILELRSKGQDIPDDLIPTSMRR